MGFRSTFVTQDYATTWPDWFREKYADTVHFSASGVLSSTVACKTHVGWDDLPEDIRKAIPWDERSWRDKAFVFVYLHECGGLTRVEIHRDGVFFNEPDSWATTAGVTHHYCDGCSAVDRPELVKVCCDHCRAWFRRGAMKGAYCLACWASRPPTPLAPA